jgi:hypothetical protein
VYGVSGGVHHAGDINQAACGVYAKSGSQISLRGLRLGMFIPDTFSLARMRCYSPKQTTTRFTCSHCVTCHNRYRLAKRQAQNIQTARSALPTSAYSPCPSYSQESIILPSSRPLFHPQNRPRAKDLPRHLKPVRLPARRTSNRRLAQPRRSPSLVPLTLQYDTPRVRRLHPPMATSHRNHVGRRSRPHR